MLFQSDNSVINDELSGSMYELVVISDNICEIFVHYFNFISVHSFLCISFQAFYSF